MHSKTVKRHEYHPERSEKSKNTTRNAPMAVLLSSLRAQAFSVVGLMVIWGIRKAKKSTDDLNKVAVYETHYNTTDCN